MTALVVLCLIGGLAALIVIVSVAFLLALGTRGRS